MNNAEFIKLHFSSFLDNVATNHTPEFWGVVTNNSSTLYAAVMQWRERKEAEMTHEKQRRFHDRPVSDSMNVGNPQPDALRREREETQERMDTDVRKQQRVDFHGLSSHTDFTVHNGRDDQWWDAIDRDAMYQEEME